MQDLFLLIKSDPFELQHLIRFAHDVPEDARFLQYFLDLVGFDMVKLDDSGKKFVACCILTIVDALLIIIR